jgi:alkylhydroperoxidase family enzyme
MRSAGSHRVRSRLRDEVAGGGRAAFFSDPRRVVGEQLSARSERFSDAELAALRFSEVLTVDSNAIPDDTYIELRAHFDEGEVVEICLVAGLFAYFNLVNDALRMEPTKYGSRTVGRFGGPPASPLAYGGCPNPRIPTPLLAVDVPL